VAYENEIDIFMRSIDQIPATTIAIVEGWAVGGGINISSACDFRIATPSAKFGSPIGRTIGNCLSSSSYARVGGAVGVQIAKRMVLLGEMITAQELLDSGFLYRIVEPEELDAAIETLVQRAAENAPLTTRTTKEAIRRMTFDALPDIQDLIASVYGSNDFRLGVHDFLAKTKKTPIWSGD
ncbi:MAG: enoyl-CoA hydratase-related protein, partial [Sphingomonas sp.]